MYKLDFVKASTEGSIPVGGDVDVDVDGDGDVDVCSGSVASASGSEAVGYYNESMDKENERPVEEGKGTPPNTAVLRLKRRIEDSPSSVLMMSYKRRKEEVYEDAAGGSAEEGSVCTQLFHLANTVPVDDNDGCLEKKIAAVVKAAREKAKSYKALSKFELKHRTTVPISSKVKEAVKKQAEENRFRVVCSKRGHEYENVSPSVSRYHNSGTGSVHWKACQEELFNMLDLVDEQDIKEFKKPERNVGIVTCNGTPMVKIDTVSASAEIDSSALKKINSGDGDDSDLGFVYDLYICRENFEFQDLHDQFVSVSKADEEIEFDDAMTDPSDEELIDHDEDSNDEMNQRNEYPDSEPESIDDSGGLPGYYEEDEFVHIFQRVNLQGDALSSDDSDQIYTMEDDGADAGYGGTCSNYHRYKSRIQREQNLADEVVSSPSGSDSD